jgi:hypothetical protein
MPLSELDCSVNVSRSTTVKLSNPLKGSGMLASVQGNWSRRCSTTRIAAEERPALGALAWHTDACLLWGPIELAGGERQVVRGDVPVVEQIPEMGT